MMRSWLAGVARGCTTNLADLLTGALSAICLAALSLQLIALWGTSSCVTLSLCAATGLGFAVGSASKAFRRASSAFTLYEEPIARFVLAAWLVASPWLLGALDFLTVRRAVFDPAQSGRNAAYVFAAALLLVGIPAFCAARLAVCAARGGRSAAGSVAWMLCGAACGLTCWAMGAAQIVGPYYLGTVAAIINLGPAIWTLVRGRPAAELDDADEASTANARPLRTLMSGFPAILAECALAACFGVLLAGFARLLEQLISGTIYLLCAEAIGLTLGLSLGLAATNWLRRRSYSPATACLFACLSCAILAIASLVAFPWLVQSALCMSAWIESSPLLLAARAALTALMFAPVGAALGICLCNTAETRTAMVPLWISFAVAGLCVALPAAEWSISTDMVVSGGAWALAILAVTRWGLSGALPANWLVRAAALGALVLVFVGPLWRDRYSPALAARLLFNTGSFLAYRSGAGMRLLPHFDEARLVGSVEGAQGTTTVWKYGANQLQIRENGMPKGLISCDPEVFPRSLAEILPAALPLVLHEKPMSVLLLGLGTGEALSTGLAFPVPEIVCWEPDAAQVRVVREVVSRECAIDPLDDDRVRLVTCDPALALDGERQMFDIVVSSPGHAGLLRTQAYFVREFYARAARRLSPAGIYCQRLQTIDLGPRPVAAIVRTMQAEFAQVLAVETGAGEMLLLATNDEAGLVRPKLSERLERPHVRALLAQSGIDWSVMLNLAAWQNDGLTKFCNDVHQPVRAANDRLAFSLPREVMRWGAKQQEMYTALAPLGGKLALWIGPDGEAPALVRRLAEVAGQQELMAKFNDQYWAYRASLRTQLTKQSRSEIEQVSASSEKKSMHPEDRRRLRYFEALGVAAGSKEPADIDLLLRFGTPYDPLLTYFVHFEAAELYARADDRDLDKELRNRLYVTWFSSPRDASLRNVIATLKLLCEHPGAEPDALRRWDQLNAALQALQQRWEARGGSRPRDVKATLNEIEDTVLAAEEAFETMDLLAAEAGIPAESWSARRTVLERNLIRPVKTYRSELLPHLHRKSGAAASDALTTGDIEQAVETNEAAVQAVGTTVVE